MHSRDAVSRRGTPPPTRFDIAFAYVRRGVEGVLFVMVSPASEAPAHGASRAKWSVLLQIVDFFQLLAFPLHNGASFPWHAMPLMQWIARVLAAVNPANSRYIGSTLKVLLVFAAAGWVSAIIAAAAFCAYSFNAGSFASVRPLQFLRVTALTTTAVLFMPLSELLISIYDCEVDTTWLGSSLECFSILHIVAMAIFTVLLACFLVFSLAVCAVFFDRSYASTSIVARAHGRVSLTMVCIKLVLTLTFTTVHESAPTLLLSLLVVTGTLWCWAWLRYLPMYYPTANYAWASGGAVFLWTSLCASLGHVLDDPASGTAGWLFFLGLPLAAASGFTLAKTREATYAVNKGDAWLSPSAAHVSAFDIELRARALLWRVVEGGSRRRNRVIKEGGATGVDALPQETQGGRVMGGLTSRGTHLTSSRASSTRVLAELCALYADAERIQGAPSALLCMFKANALSCFDDDARALSLVAILDEGLAARPALDVRFLLQQAKRYVTEGDGDNPLSSRTSSSTVAVRVGANKSATKRFSIIEQVQVDQALDASVTQSLLARSCELAFWAELRRSVPRAVRLLACSEDLAAATASATSAFQRLLALDPDSLEALQLYGIFLLEVKRDSSAARNTFQAAQDLVAARANRTGGAVVLQASTTVSALKSGGPAKNGAAMRITSASAYAALQHERVMAVATSTALNERQRRTSVELAVGIEASAVSTSASNVVEEDNDAPQTTSEYQYTMADVVGSPVEQPTSVPFSARTAAAAQRTLEESAERGREEALRQKGDESESAGAALRNTLASSKSHMSSAMLRLMRVLLMLSFVSAALFLASTAVQSALVPQILATSALASTAAVRQLILEDCLSDVSVLSEYARHVRPLPQQPPLVASAPGPNATQASLSKNAVALGVLHSALFLAAQDAAELDLYTLPALLVTEFSAPTDPVSAPFVASPSSVMRAMGLTDLGERLVSDFHVIAALPLDNVTQGDPHVAFALFNGGNAARAGFDSAMLLITARARRFSALLDNINLAFFIAGCLLVGGFSAFVVFPAIFAASQQMRAVFAIFIALPPDTVASMERVSILQMAAINQHYTQQSSHATTRRSRDVALEVEEATVAAKDVDGEDGNMGSEGGVSSAEEGEGSSELLQRHQHGQAHNAAPTPKYRGMCCGSSRDRKVLPRNKVAQPLHLLKKRTLQWSPVLLRLLLRFLWPQLLIALSFSGMWWYARTASSSTVQLLQSVLYFGQMDALFAQLDLRVGAALASPDGTACNATSLRAALASTDDLTLTVFAYGDALLFGNATMGLSAATSLSPTLSSILLVDGCTVPNMPSGCESDWALGLLAGGVQGALREALSLARYALTSQLAAVNLAKSSGAPCPPPVSLETGAIVDTVSQGARVYLRAALVAIVSILHASLSSQAGAFVAGHAGLTAVIILAIALLWVVAAHISVRQLDRDTKLVRAMLLIVPPDVLVAVARAMAPRKGGPGSHNSSFTLRALTGAE